MRPFRRRESFVDLLAASYVYKTRYPFTFAPGKNAAGGALLRKALDEAVQSGLGDAIGPALRVGQWSVLRHVAVTLPRTCDSAHR